MTANGYHQGRARYQELVKMFSAIAHALAPHARNHHVLYDSELTDGRYILQLTHEEIAQRWGVKTARAEPHRLQLYESRDELIRDTGIWWKPNGAQDGLCFTMIPFLGAYWYVLDKAQAANAEARRAEQALLVLHDRLSKRYRVSVLKELTATFADLKITAGKQEDELYKLWKLAQLIRQEDEKKRR